MSQPAENETLPQEQKPKLWVYLLPLGLFGVLMIFFFFGLGLNPRLLPSPLIGQPAPDFSLPKLSNPDETIQNVDLTGEVSLLNIWATWCTSCRQEHPVLMKIAESKEVPIHGLYYKDQPALGIEWLNNYGNPYYDNAVDMDGKVGIEWGAYGTPETFVIDQEGIIRYKHVGPISWHDWQTTLLPLINLLKNNNGV
ncbi:MAG: DsbE family thiol:disulfide interchange protein [Proteobacteria bacterium]|nr:DsbE family thiol:disulfide interchange protein [Pseudomonadota bacterium]NOG59316.1 DsbE family thiol:disulfide interchange protein [Pseudomonadota bacterium]